MSNSFNAATIPQSINTRAVFQNLPASDQARVQAIACDTPAPIKLIKPAMPERPAPQAPSVDIAASPTPIEAIDAASAKSKTGLANRLGAKLLNIGASVKTFWQKIIGAIVSGASAVSHQIDKGAQATKSFVMGLVDKKPAVSEGASPTFLPETSTPSDVAESK